MASVILPKTPYDCATLVDLLRARALNQPGKRAYTFLADGETEEVSLTYAELDQQARAIGAQLQQMGAGGGRVLLLYPPGLEYLAAFFGCLYAGAAAVPAYPPRLHRSLSKIQSIVRDAQPSAVLTTSSILYRAGSLFAMADDLTSMPWLASDNPSHDMSQEWAEPGLRAESLALLQYTSGSTAAPKGVMVSHGNLLHNEEMIRAAIGQNEEATFVSWLPLYHDLGLIGNMLHTLYLGAYCVLMSPAAFLQRPINWLRAISRFKATTSGGPNFAYDLCVRNTNAEQRAGLELGRWQIAFNGAEPIRRETLESFAETFAPYGFRRGAFYPCYGLAEATLLVSGAGGEGRPGYHAVKRSCLEEHTAADASPAEGDDVAVLVSCGRAFLGQKVLIVDPSSLTPCPPDRVGEVWVSGPSIARGYWGKPEVTRQTFEARLADTGEGPFLRTGDLGFMRDGELLITGRLKDLIIIAGRNHYPQDIEFTVEKSHPLIRRGCTAAFSVGVLGEERLVVVAEVEPLRGRERRHRGSNGDDGPGARLPSELEAVQMVVRRAVAEQHDVQLHALALIKAGTLPKTSSSKVRRGACREAFLDGTLEQVGGATHERHAPQPA